MVGEDELDVHGKYLEQLMLDPGDKTKMLKKSPFLKRILKFSSMIPKMTRN